MAKADGPEDIKARMGRWMDIDNPFRQFLSRIGDKWSLLVILCLLSVPKNRCRFSELRNLIPGISQRMLTLTLRNLEQDGLITRHVFAEVPPRVEYELTDLGKSIKAPIRSLYSWLLENWPTARKFREKHGR